MGDDADHDGRHHQGDGHKGDEQIADAADDVGDGAHEQGHIVGVGDPLVLGKAAVILPDEVGHPVLVGKGGGIEADGGGAVRVHIAQQIQVFLIGGPGAGGGHVVVIKIDILLPGEGHAGGVPVPGGQGGVQHGGQLPDAHGLQPGPDALGILLAHLSGDGLLHLGEELLVAHVRDVGRDGGLVHPHLLGVLRHDHLFDAGAGQAVHLGVHHALNIVGGGLAHGVEIGLRLGLAV